MVAIGKEVCMGRGGGSYREGGVYGGGEKVVAIGKEVCMGRGEGSYREGGVYGGGEKVVAIELKVLHNSFHSTPLLKGSRDLVLSLADIQKPLTRESYKERFLKLLLWEENEQRLALLKRWGLPPTLLNAHTCEVH